MAGSVPGLMNAYRRLPVAFVRGAGAWLYDEHGEAFLDALGGIAVCGLGHAHPAVSDALKKQSETLLHTSNLYRIPLQEQLAEKLRSLAGMDSVFFCNSGAEANEAAIKIARLHGQQKKICDPGIVTMENSFHGRTLATLSASGNRNIQRGFDPLPPGFVHIPFGDIAALQKTLADHPEITAVLLEPIQGEGGVRLPPPGYLSEMRQLCDRHGLLLILDEVQTGNGRTGHYFHCRGEGIQADVLTTAKGLGNGMPIGVCMARGEAAQMLQPGNHGTTFGGNPLACAAALAVVETIARENLCARAEQLGARLMEELHLRLKQCETVVEIRGRGLMIGIELVRPCAALTQLALQQKLLINVTAEQVVRLLPPLILSDAEAEKLLDILCALIRNF